jgi:mannose-6-phosphate isomerase-like protein (cupin superfamily)
MVKKFSELPVTLNENMRGGDGTVQITHLADKAGMHDKNRLFAKITLKPGCSVGYHVHEAETEIYHILSGTGVYDDNGVSTVTVNAGDTTYTPPGQGHSIANNTDTDLEFIALIILE